MNYWKFYNNNPYVKTRILKWYKFWFCLPGTGLVTGFLVVVGLLVVGLLVVGRRVDVLVVVGVVTTPLQVLQVFWQLRLT